MAQEKSFPVTSMNIEIEMIIGAAPERVFAALTTGTALWWGAPYLENKDAHDLVMELRLGGRFYECWTRPSSDKDGSLLGTITALNKPALLKMEGSFGMGARCSHGIVTFYLKRSHLGTQVQFSHKAIGDITDEVRERYSVGWNDLLNRLKKLIEVQQEGGLRHEPAFD